ncbi:MAG: Xaa-Pro peptidase family protein [Chloroflexota bacterium]
MPNRLSRLRSRLAEKGIDALFVSQPENRYYLSGFLGSSGFLLIDERNAVLATDFRYLEQAKAQAPDFTIFPIKNNLNEWLPALADGLRGKRLGFEAGDIPVATHRRMQDALKKADLPVRLVPAESLVEELRAVKEPGEIELITRAARLADEACEEAIARLEPGQTELEIAWEIEQSLRERGSQSVPFEIIVASGPNAALPHHRPTDRPVQKGEPITIDMGAKVAAYASDLTRTVCLGRPDETFRKIYDAVLGAQLAAMAIIKEGMTGAEADSLARTVIQEAGYGEAFGHALGHGVGLATHEAPRLGPGTKETLLSGMVFTIEPGIYLPGWGGVRIEDLVVMESGGVRALSRAEKVTRYDRHD